ncbi:hypothetical protein [Noviherbaspirillum pedocola]|uniref:Uncharacterized protein n=1 Tax=Noviherbaspirillum pedocola TaxID=2801341 RepID=A0A934W6V6_9BURK|nr:hypothetical protein [Noviherbaspirillum pedocola]MBK4733974.1 hypothetical protein [Noviherbaspirillum pedocola]
MNGIPGNPSNGRRGRARRLVKQLAKETANVVHPIQVAIQQHPADRMSAADAPYPALRVQTRCTSHSPMARIHASPSFPLRGTPMHAAVRADCFLVG